jgi:hypothetical protein
MALAETVQQVVDSLPDDWTDLELDLPSTSRATSNLRRAAPPPPPSAQEREEQVVDGHLRGLRERPDRFAHG